MNLFVLVGITRQEATMGEAARGGRSPYWLLLLATSAFSWRCRALRTFLPEMMR